MNFGKSKNVGIRLLFDLRMMEFITKCNRVGSPQLLGFNNMIILFMFAMSIKVYIRIVSQLKKFLKKAAISPQSRDGKLWNVMVSNA